MARRSMMRELTWDECGCVMMTDLVVALQSSSGTSMSKAYGSGRRCGDD
jgi:hypothetical protein